MNLKKITDGGFHLIDLDGDFAFLTMPDVVERKLKAFKVSIENKIIEIDKNIIFQKKLGTQLLKITEYFKLSCDELFVYYSITQSKNGNVFLCTFRNNIIYGFNNGEKFYEHSITNDSIYSIAFEDPEFIWLAYPVVHTVSKFSIKKNEEVFKIGNYEYDTVEGILDHPETLIINGQSLYISSMGNKKVFEIDLKTNQIIMEQTFDSFVWEYVKIKDKAYVSLDTGIFEVII